MSGRETQIPAARPRTPSAAAREPARARRVPKRGLSLRRRLFGGVLLGVAALALLGCERETPPSKARPAHDPAVPSPPPTPASNARAPFRFEPVRGTPTPLPRVFEGAPRSSHGVVTSVNAEATRIGVEILEAGGNAIDAAVATGFALAVTHQSAASLGGGGFLLLLREGQLTSFDFREQAPEGLSEPRFAEALRAGGGPGSVGVPGIVSGLLTAHERHGSLSRARVLEGARRLASGGYSLSAHQERALAGVRATFSRSATARTLFLRDGRVPAPGTRLENPPLARLLGRIAEEGASAFYGPSVGAELSATTLGTLHPQDLSRYSALERRPLHASVDGYDVYTMAPPSGGGVVLLESLGLVRPLLAKEGPLAAEDLHRLAEALRRGHVDRRLVVSDPLRMDSTLVAAEFAPLLAPERHASHPILDRKRTPSAELDERYGAALAELEHTTHFSVVDARGNAVSCTVTLSSSYGSRLVTPSGFVLNNSVLSFASAGANRPSPSVRTVSSMTPTLVTHPSGLVLVLGSPGGDTIPGTVLQLLVRVLRGASLAEAVRAPRLHQAFVPDRLFVERTFPAPLLGELRSFGHDVEPRAPIGDANVAAFDGTESVAIADAREGGLAARAAPRRAR